MGVTEEDNTCCTECSLSGARGGVTTIANRNQNINDHSIYATNPHHSRSGFNTFQAQPHSHMVGNPTRRVALPVRKGMIVIEQDPVGEEYSSVHSELRRALHEGHECGKIEYRVQIPRQIEAVTM